MFLYLSVVFLGFLLLAYTIRWLRKPFFDLAEDSLSMVNTLMLKIEEDEKVKLVQKKNTQLIFSLFKVLFSVAVAIVVCCIPFVFYALALEKTYDELELSSFAAILSLSIGSTVGFVIPIKKKTTEGYSELSQLLHRLSLDNYAVAYKLFKIEAKKSAKLGIEPNKRFIIVSGLARSGTTSLMNRLSEYPRLKTLDYSNMPFLTAPNLWKKIYRPKNSEKKERSHQDGIMIGLESNEALEEYFFKVLDQDGFIQEHALKKYELPTKDYEDYLRYQAIIRNDNEAIYLAKNNNFILRYDSVRKLNDQFVAVFMYRDPLSHAASLLEKHKDYSSMQEEDPFVLDYMNWLGHHEFGLNHKPFQFSEEPSVFGEDKQSLDHWLQIWINYYEYLLSIDTTNVLFVNYEDYCLQPKETLKRIVQKTELQVAEMEVKAFHNSRTIKGVYSDALLKEAEAIYQKLQTIEIEK